MFQPGCIICFRLNNRLVTGKFHSVMNNIATVSHLGMVFTRHISEIALAENVYL